MQNAEAKEKLDGAIITTIHNSIAFRVMGINGFGLGLGVTKRTCVAAVCFWCVSLILLLILLFLLGCSANDTTRHVIFYVMLQLLLREKGERKDKFVCVQMGVKDVTKDLVISSCGMCVVCCPALHFMTSSSPKPQPPTTSSSTTYWKTSSSFPNGNYLICCRFCILLYSIRIWKLCPCPTRTDRDRRPIMFN